MKKGVLLLMSLLMVGQLSACGKNEADLAPDVFKAESSHAVQLRNEPDDSLFEQKAEMPAGYMTTDSFYGLVYEVPDYMNRSEDDSSSYMTYVNHDEKPVSYVSCQVTTDAWSDIELKDVSEISYDDAVFEDMTGNKGDGYRRTAHYFFTTDQTNAGEHEMQVLVSVVGDSEKSCDETLSHIMQSMDFSEFYFDNFAE